MDLKKAGLDDTHLVAFYINAATEALEDWKNDIS